MNTLFLDFDGVLHPVTAIEGLTPHHPQLLDAMRSRDMFRWVPLLDEILHANEDITIAVHSSWKQYLDNAQLQEVLGPLASRLIGITPRGTGRFHGIIELIERARIDNHIIVDDAIDEFPWNLPELVATNPLKGINDREVLDRISDWVGIVNSNTPPAPAHPYPQRA